MLTVCLLIHLFLIILYIYLPADMCIQRDFKVRANDLPAFVRPIKFSTQPLHGDCNPPNTPAPAGRLEKKSSLYTRTGG